MEFFLLDETMIFINLLLELIELLLNKVESQPSDLFILLVLLTCQ
jgi:hypothetical protein